ncbi:MAG: hypothetical protein KJ718_06105 [Nanoarchaeota archaeon]|nr:hypothetical protein [Nanoarchaeota archaeon]MBU1052095.1 hypothetical protein [Nanoarchaeota archaeon]MBU1988639.1 hypothetical protein [Nanoarchaeota archaeon]
MTQTTTLDTPSQVITFIPQPMIKRPEKTKTLILDSGTLINLSMNGLLYIIPELKKLTNTRFAITEQVKYETLDRPIKIPRFQLEALRIKKLIDSKELEMPSSFSISNEKIKSKSNELLHIANHTVQARGKFINIVSDAEMSCLALSSILTERGIKNIIAIDERTTRILAEKPENLQKIMSKKLHFHVKLKTTNFNLFKDFKFIRSSELAYVACKKGVLNVKDPKALEAVLFATKYKGSSISHDEIKALKKL